MNLLERLAKFFNVSNVGDTDANKGECVGLVMSYADTLGLPHTWGNAKDLLTNADPNAFAITHNDPNDLNQFPQAGSIMVWGDAWGNGFGHTGVVIFADGRVFSTLEQNNPVGHAPQTAMHNYSGVIGWITPKNLPKTPTVEELTACMTDRDNLWKQRDDALAKVEEIKKHLDEVNQKLTTFAALGYASIDDVSKKLDDKDKTIQGLSTQLQQVLDDNKTLATLVAKKEEQDSTAIDEGRNAQLKVVELERQLNMIAVQTKTMPTASAILNKFDTLTRWAAWGENILRKQTIDNANKKNENEQKKSGSFLSDFFAIFIGGGDSV